MNTKTEDVSQHDIPKSACPCCKVECDMASSIDVNNEGPKPGDLNLCAYCGFFQIYGEDRLLHPPTPDQLIELGEEVVAGIITTQQRIRASPMAQRHGTVS